MTLALILPRERVDLADYAWFVPGVIVTIVIAATLSALLAGRIGERRSWAFGLLFSLGLIASATLTPSRDAIRFGFEGTGTCDLSQLTPIGLRELLRFDERSLNVFLFVPLGLVVGLARSRRILSAVLGVAIVLPVAIETVQMVARPLGRACEAADVIDNLSGFAIGFVAALLLVLGARRLAEPPGPGPKEHRPTG